MGYLLGKLLANPPREIGEICSVCECYAAPVLLQREKNRPRAGNDTVRSQKLAKKATQVQSAMTESGRPPRFPEYWSISLPRRFSLPCAVLYFTAIHLSCTARLDLFE